MPDLGIERELWSARDELNDYVNQLKSIGIHNTWRKIRMSRWTEAQKELQGYKRKLAYGRTNRVIESSTMGEE